MLAATLTGVSLIGERSVWDVGQTWSKAVGVGGIIPTPALKLGRSGGPPVGASGSAVARATLSTTRAARRA